MTQSTDIKLVRFTGEYGDDISIPTGQIEMIQACTSQRNHGRTRIHFVSGRQVVVDHDINEVRRLIGVL